MGIEWSSERWRHRAGGIARTWQRFLPFQSYLEVCLVDCVVRRDSQKSRRCNGGDAGGHHIRRESGRHRIQHIRHLWQRRPHWCLSTWKSRPTFHMARLRSLGLDIRESHSSFSSSFSSSYFGKIILIVMIVVIVVVVVARSSSLSSLLQQWAQQQRRATTHCPQSAARNDTWRIDMQCAFPGPTATCCCSC